MCFLRCSFASERHRNRRWVQVGHLKARMLLGLLRVCFNGPLNCSLWISAHFHSTVCGLGVELLATNDTQMSFEAPRTGNAQRRFREESLGVGVIVRIKMLFAKHKMRQNLQSADNQSFYSRAQDLILLKVCASSLITGQTD